MSLAEWAKQNKLNPNHKLPLAGNLEQAEKHTDDAILTLLFADDLDASTRKTFKVSWLWREEKSVEYDGATYHSPASARYRHCLRQEAL